MSNRNPVGPNETNLNETDALSVSAFEKFTDRNLTKILAVLFYLVPLILGLHYDYFFMKSPLVRWTAYVMGFCASAISWIPAFLTAGITFGKFDFAKEVFRLYSVNDFKIAMSLIFLTLPIAWILIKTIHGTLSSYLHKKIIFCITGIFVIACLASAFEYMSNLKNQYVYIFSCAIIGIIYFALLSRSVNAKKTSMRERY